MEKNYVYPNAFKFLKIKAADGLNSLDNLTHYDILELSKNFLLDCLKSDDGLLLLNDKILNIFIEFINDNKLDLTFKPMLLKTIASEFKLTLDELLSEALEETKEAFKDEYYNYMYNYGRRDFLRTCHKL